MPTERDYLSGGLPPSTSRWFVLKFFGNDTHSKDFSFGVRKGFPMRVNQLALFDFNIYHNDFHTNNLTSKGR
jgi:hypothetical protein